MTRQSRSFPVRTRERISAAKIVDRLIAFVEGEIELSSTQVQAAKVLLDRVLPSLKAVEIEAVDPSTKPIREQTNEELLLSLYRTPGGLDNFAPVLERYRDELHGSLTK